MIRPGNDKIGLLFSTTKNVFGFAIRTATWSDWSHVSIVDGTYVIEAVAPHGVRRATLDSVLKSYTRHELCYFPCMDAGKIIKAAMSQIGKPYDYTAVLGIGIHRDWQEKDSWFCSELAAWSFDAAGEPLFRAEVMRRVTPNHLWMISPQPVAAMNSGMAGT